MNRAGPGVAVEAVQTIRQKNRAAQDAKAEAGRRIQWMSHSDLAMKLCQVHLGPACRGSRPHAGLACRAGPGVVVEAPQTVRQKNRVARDPEALAGRRIQWTSHSDLTMKFCRIHLGLDCRVSMLHAGPACRAGPGVVLKAVQSVRQKNRAAQDAEAEAAQTIQWTSHSD